MKFFRVNIVKRYNDQVIIVAKDHAEVGHIANKIIHGHDFDNFDNFDLDVDSLIETYPDDNLKKEIKDFGYYDGLSNDIHYDNDIFNLFDEISEKQAKEEWLKKNHLEFHFK